MLPDRQRRRSRSHKHDVAVPGLLVAAAVHNRAGIARRIRGICRYHSLATETYYSSWCRRSPLALANAGISGAKNVTQPPWVTLIAERKLRCRT